MENYQLLKQFKFKHSAQANEKAFVKGKHYRFTVLTGRLIRMEYSPEGVFEDRPSQTFWFRKQPVPEFQVLEKGNQLEIITSHLHLYYEKDAPFSENTLKIARTNDKSGNYLWHYGKKSNRNLKGTYRTLDDVDGELRLEEGLMSRDGYSVFDDSKTFVFGKEGWLEKRNPNNIDLYFFGYGHDYEACLRDFYKVSGQTPLIPRFALGNWWSKFWNYTDEEMKELVEEFEKRDIPLSTFIIDIDWHLREIPKEYGDGWTGYTWNRANYPDPEAFLDFLKSKNLKISLNLHPASGIRAYEECYPQVAEFMGINQETKEPVPFDCTDPKFMEAYFRFAHHPLEEMGVDFWWIDWQQGTTSKFPGLDPLWMLNHLHFLDLGRDGKKRGFVFSRWPGLGGHRYPIGFSGDAHVTWESLAFQPYFTATAANVGYGWWSHDIGGHCFGKEEPELYTRWVQFGVFSPIMRLHSTNKYYHKREPWRWDLNTEKITTYYLRLRHQLIPYLYSMNYLNSEYGLPLIYPLYYHYPYHEEAYRQKNIYFFGSEMLVAPFITPLIKDLNRSRLDVWLPEGLWFNFFNGDVYQGNHHYSLYGGIEEINAFAKAGAIIPLAELTEDNQYKNPEILNVQIFPGNDNQFVLYEDDGETLAYKNGFYALTIFTLKAEKQALELEIEVQDQKAILPKKREIKLCFRNIVPNVKISSSVVYEYDSNLKAYSLTINPQAGEKVTLRLETETEDIIDSSFDYINKIMDLLDRSTYETSVKTEIGFFCPRYNQNREGLLAENLSVKELILEIQALNIDYELKNAILNILFREF
ncbi:MAG: TIM-barrel domain-containing protein [Bacilli bacterium]|jgi:alpha-glucosidase (family GH31 glycosyl hydrolase)